ncbi:MAG: type II toxin-antitoxin system VapC family toxin [Planctomycetota bacterium]
MIVVDTNLIAYLCMEGPRTESARQLHAADPEWLAPLLWRSEYLNVLTTMMKQRLLSMAQAEQSWDTARGIVLPVAAEPTGRAVLNIAAHQGISAYDAQFVALAQAYSVPMVTCDRALSRKCVGIAWLVDAYLDTAS